ncbi:hypothetical protein D9757_005618 [Collybiopsis confluens]|uniref:Ankyrin n=1 Tax=Collybiopsis confluens TaxID=2823264 RepID=A0A8H5MCG0_9AGAR|nr:hypothetical protein D9757_005618 [Collybiopsis confluens]
MPGPLRANANLRAEAKYNVVTEFPNYDLHSAAASGNLGLVEYALARGQPVNSVLDGVLPLHAACSGGHDQVVKLLIDHGADVNAARLPRRYSNEKSREASVPIAGTTGSTPLHFAAAHGNKNVITTLLLRGAHPDRRDKHSITPAMLAEQNGWLECAQALNNWIKDKDRDLRERGQLDENPPGSPPSMAHASSGIEDDIRMSTRKHIQVKRSIDTALNMFKNSSASSTPQSKLVINSTLSSTYNVATLSPTSPTRSRRDFSPSPSEDGRFSPSPSPTNPGSRRPSLPHIFQTPPNSSQRVQKPTTLLKARHPRRPRSAGTDAEREPEADNNSANLGRSAGKKLGTKYSLLNLFKKGNETGGVPLERTSSHQSSASLTFPNQTSSVKMSSALLNSPKQSASLLYNNDALPSSGYRFGGSANDMSLKTRAASSPSNTRSPPSMPSLLPQQSYASPSRPLAVDLHNALAAHQHLPHRDRSGSSSSVTKYERSIGLGISFDEADTAVNRPPMRRYLPSDSEHSRDRSGSNASNRNAAVFDDEVIISAGPNNSSSGNVSITESLNGATSRNNSRPSILRGHNRTSSSSQPRSLRFDSSASMMSGSGVVGRRESDAQSPRSVTIPLRGSISASSLNRLHDERDDASRPQLVTLNESRVPDSAPANIADFDLKFVEESEYGRPIESSLTARTRLDIPIRNRGFSFTSSESSLSPTLSAGEGTTVTNALPSEFPFSINAPPPIDESVDAALLQVPAPQSIDSRLRGDSISSTSTADSGMNPSLSASATTSGSGGSGAIPTPMISPEGGSYLTLASAPDSWRIKNVRENIGPSEALGDDYRTGLDAGPVQAAGDGLEGRRVPSELDLIESHAQAEALVQRTQQDILAAHADGQGSSGMDSMPLSARLAALGASLELERRLREQRKAEELKAPGTAASLGDAGSSIRTEILRQASLDQLSKSYSSQNEVRRPHANSEGSRIGTLTNFYPSIPERAKPTHHPSLSASVVETSSPALKPDADSPTMSFNGRRTRSRTPDPENNLSRISSLDGLDVETADTELGPPLYRVSTAPNSSYSARDRRERELASVTKLTRMGFSPSEIAHARVAPPKRFGGLKSLMQTWKGGRQI